MQPLTKASSTPLLRHELLSKMPLHFVENTHTKPSWTPLSQQESPPRMHLLMQQGGHKTVEGFAPYFVHQRIAKLECNKKMDIVTPATNWYPRS
jgi:hypothetical protein